MLTLLLLVGGAGRPGRHPAGRSGPVRAFTDVAGRIRRPVVP